MVTRNALCQAIDIFPGEEGKRNIYYYTWVGIYFIWLMAVDTYTEVSCESGVSITIAKNVYVST